jgi:hypothetical protein
MSAAPKGHSAVRAMKKPGKLSSGEVWENLELYPTPPWATRALFEHVLPFICGRPTTAWDCCAGLGHMAAVLTEYVERWHASDVHLYDLDGGETTADFGVEKGDFFDRYCAWPFIVPGWIITNPPFVPAVDILEKALALDGVEGVALLLRLQWLTTEDRYARVFSKRPPMLVAPFVERVPMVLGGYDPAASTATDYAWFVWPRRNYYADIELRHIPPCRAALSRDSDRELARRCVPGFVPPSQLKKLSPGQAGLALT